MWNIYVGPSGSVNISFGAEWKCEEFMWDWVNMWKFQVGPSKMWKSRWADQKCEKFRCGWVSPVRYPCFLIEWIFYWIEYSQFQNFEWYFELNFVRKLNIESTFELNVVEKWKLNKCLNWIRRKTEKWINVWIEFHWKQDK